MKITINGASFECTQDEPLNEVLLRFEAKEPFAVALNGVFLPRSRCSDIRLTQGDSIELLSPVQGG